MSKGKWPRFLGDLAQPVVERLDAVGVVQMTRRSIGGKDRKGTNLSQASVKVLTAAG